MATSLVQMERAVVEVPHVRIVPFCQNSELADLIDHCPKNPESLLEGWLTHLPFPVRLSLCQSVLYEPIVDPSVVDICGLWLIFSVRATYEILLVQHLCLGLKNQFRETAHDLGIDRVPYY